MHALGVAFVLVAMLVLLLGLRLVRRRGAALTIEPCGCHRNGALQLRRCPIHHT